MYACLLYFTERPLHVLTISKLLHYISWHVAVIQSGGVLYFVVL